MYQLLIVEDEPIDREAIKLMIQINSQEIAGIYEAGNALEAMEIFDRVNPDLVIMDINLPGINGLDTIKTLQGKKALCKFIILSAHNEFQYAQAALKLSVHDYILKPAKMEIIAASLRSAIKSLEADSLEEKSERRLRDRVDSILPVVENDCLRAMIAEKTDVVKTLFSFLEISMACGFCLIIRCNNLRRKVLGAVKADLKRMGIACVAEQVNELLVFLILFEAPAEDSLRITAMNITLNTLHEFGSIRWNVGVGSLVLQIHLLHVSYMQALEALSASADTPGKHRLYQMPSQDPQPSQDSPDNAPDAYSVSDRKGQQSSGAIARSAVCYIQNHYTQKISLNSLANRLGVTPFYLSRLIKQDTGENFTDILNKARLERARELLLTDMSIKEITYSLGFNSQNYFSKLFKKYYALSPSEYRNQ